MNLFREGKISYRLFVGITIAAILIFAAYQQSQVVYQKEKVAFQNIQNNHREDLIVRVKGLSLQTQVAKTLSERATGLSDHKSLNSNQAMLFIFEQDARHSFWMRNMNFPIDILWLDANKKIVHIEESLSPDSYPKSFVPDKPARYVVEVTSGFVQGNMINVGDRFQW